MSNYRVNFKRYLDDLKSPTPALGGGSVVALSFCLGISLLEKAINYSRAQQPQLKTIQLKLQKLAVKVYPFIDRDGEIFEQVINTKGEQRKSWLKLSEQLVVGLGDCCQVAYWLAKAARPKINKFLISDYKLGTQLIKLSFKGCIENLEANAKFLGKKNCAINRFKQGIDKY